MGLEPHNSLPSDLKAMVKPGEVQVACKLSGETLIPGTGKNMESIQELHRFQNVLTLHAESDLKI